MDYQLFLMVLFDCLYLDLLYFNFYFLIYLIVLFLFLLGTYFTLKVFKVLICYLPREILTLI